jgi:hypothetical protein
MDGPEMPLVGWIDTTLMPDSVPVMPALAVSVAVID